MPLTSQVQYAIAGTLLTMVCAMLRTGIVCLDYFIGCELQPAKTSASNTQNICQGPEGLSAAAHVPQPVFHIFTCLNAAEGRSAGSECIVALSSKGNVTKRILQSTPVFARAAAGKCVLRMQVMTAVLILHCMLLMQSLSMQCLPEQSSV